MKAKLALAIVSIGMFGLLGPMPADARGGGSHSGAHVTRQSHPSAAKPAGAKKTGDKAPHTKHEMKDATVSGVTARKKKKSKPSLSPITFRKRKDQASP